MSRLTRVALVCLLLLAAWRPAEAALAVVGTTTDATVTPAPTSLTITRTGVGVGNLLVACAGVWNVNGTTIAVSDGSGAYTQAFSKFLSTGTETQVHCYYKANVAGGTTVVVFDPAGASADIDAFVMEISGAAITSALDVTVTGEAAVAAGASFTASVATAALSQANNIVIGIMGHSMFSGMTLNPGATPWTQIAEQENQSGGQAYNAQYKTVSATTAVTVAWAQANNTAFAGNWIAGAAVFKELVSGDVTPPTDPTSLIASNVTSFRNDLTWTGSTDAGGSLLSGYEILGCTGALCSPTGVVATSATTTYIDNGLAAGTIYGYAVRAYDGAGNRSGQTATSYVTTLATQSKTVSWTPVAPLTQDGFTLRSCTTVSAACTPDTFLTTVGPGATSYVHTASGRPVTCYDVQATLSGTAGSGISAAACSTAVATQFTLTIVHAGTGTCATTPAAGPSIYPSGTVVPLTAAGAADSDFTVWSGTGVTDSGGGAGTTTMSADRTATATCNLQTGDFAYVAHRGSLANSTSGITLTFSPTATIAAGQLAVARCSADNAAVTSGQTNEHAFADSVGNVWVKLREHTNAGGAANAGVTTSQWASKMVTQLTTANTVTLTLSSARVAKVCALEQFNLAGGQTFSLTSALGTVGTSTTPSAVISGLSSASTLFLGAVGIEGPLTDTYTQAPNFKADTASVGTAVATAASNVANRFGFRRVTGTGDTFAPVLGTSRDWAATLVALRAIAQPATFTITATKSGTGTGTVTINGVTTLGPVTFNTGTVVQIQAIPDSNNMFDAWTTTSGSSCIASAAGIDPVQSVTLTSNTICNVQITNTPATPGPWDLTIAAISGTGTGTTTPAVSSVTSHVDGFVVNLVATPAAGSFFGGWTGTGCTSGSVTMTVARTCTPVFTLLPTFVLTLTTTGTGQGSVSGAGTFVQNTLTPILATPASGSVFAGWTGTTGCAAATPAHNVLMDGTKTCTATFNVATATAPSGVLVTAPSPRCTAEIDAHVATEIGISLVTWKVDGIPVATCGPPTASCVSTVVGATQKPPSQLAPGLYRYSMRKTLVGAGSEVMAEFDDAAGQTGIIGPFVTSCP